jgi:GNAT superfamily N-acetyltransferase
MPRSPVHYERLRKVDTTEPQTNEVSVTPPARVAIRELPVGETHLAYRAMCELRPAYRDERAFVEHVDNVLRPAGYRLVAVFAPGREHAAAVAGFRVGDSLACGHHLYVDDLSTTTDARRQGHAGALLDWIIDEARELGCGQLHLDSNTSAERFDAHRLYYNNGLGIRSYHFARALT